MTEVLRQALAGGDAVAAVVVTYQVDAEALEGLLRALHGEVAAVVVVDNASLAWRELRSPLPLQVIRLPHNLGVAAAQNRGVEAALAQGAAQVLLLDQDSRPEPGLVAALRQALAAAQAAGRPAAAAGPAVVDEHGVVEGFVRFRSGRYEAIAPPADGAPLDCDMLIASGQLIPRQGWQRVGPMAEGLFIDKVDTEWCLRATQAGLCLLGVPAARLHHRLGERQLRLWFGRWRTLPQHRPFRYYYMWRNSLLLRRLPHAGAAWRRADTRQLRSLLLYFGLLAPGRWAALRMMGRGLLDGWRGVQGPLK